MVEVEGVEVERVEVEGDRLRGLRGWVGGNWLRLKGLRLVEGGVVTG